MKRLSFMLAIACTLTCTCYAQTKLRIVTGYEKAVIQTDTASSIELYAATELQRTIRLMTGIELNIIHKDQIVNDGKIIIGNTQTNSRIATAATVLQLKGAGKEKIAVKKEGYILYLASNTARGALYATYTFLQDHLGARWYWPDSTGEFLPKHDSIIIEQLFISQQPALNVRSLAITGYRTPTTEVAMEQTDVWMARNRLNWVSDRSATTAAVLALRRQKGFLIRRAGHNVVVPNEIITTAALQSTDSVLAAMRNGRRMINATSSNEEHLCWSNTRAQDSVAKMLASWWNKSPHPEVIHFYPADHQRFCQCQPCRNMTANPSDIASRWQIFSDSVIKRLRTLVGDTVCERLKNSLHDTLPCKQYWTYAYWDYKAVPVTTAPFHLIPYALSDGCYRHLLSDSLNTDDILAKNEINGWLNTQRNIGIRGYEFIMFKTPMYVPMVSWVVDQMKWIRKKGFTGYMSELPYYDNPLNAEPEKTWWNCSRMSLYAATRALWDTGVTAAQITMDWCDKVYGPAKYDMDGYYWDMDSAWRAGTKKITGFNKTPRLYFDRFITSGLFHKSYKRLADALHRISINTTIDTARRNRIAYQILLEREMLDNWNDTFQTANGRENRYRTAIMKRTSTGTLLTELPGFEIRWGELSAYPTKVTAGWTDNDLHLTILTAEQELIATGAFVRNDQTTFTNGLEIYIQPDSTKPDFVRFRIDPVGSYSDAATYSGILYDSSWNASCSVWTGTNNNNELVYNVQIQFNSMGLTAVEGKQFRMAIRRKATNGSITGWPETNSAYVGLFSLVQLVNSSEIQNNLIVAPPRYKEGTLERIKIPSHLLQTYNISMTGR